ncbi:hypothetical protein [Halopenitus persicus]|uniref:Uncharacterized protein n=1 Tax=Halopenitus persicus TaxID=1048396 RepID=A0A1H3MU73_9EURY|nr:hypothetical protein [Halopenitus persicus]SDY80247.1 hypothetical protein SAMN05216564_11091 [Halopenitus persicus]
MPDGAHKKVKLNVRVTSSKKEEWLDSLNDDENLSSLVRRAVDKEINDEYIPKKAINNLSGNTGQADVDLSPLLDQIDDLQRSVTSVENKIDTISVTQADEGEDEDIEELAMDLLPRLPTYPNDIPNDVLEGMGGIGERSPREFILYIMEARQEISHLSIDGSAQRLSSEIREPTYLVKEALCYLENSTTENVHSAIIDGTRHWMRL